MVECRTPEREVRGSRPTAAVLCPWARHFTPQKYWLITQEAMAPFRHDWKIVDWDVKPQHNQPTILCQKINVIRFLSNWSSSPFLSCCGAGTAADTEMTTQLISSQLQLHKLNTNRTPRVCTANRLLKQMLFRQVTLLYDQSSVTTWLLTTCTCRW